MVLLNFQILLAATTALSIVYGKTPTRVTAAAPLTTSASKTSSTTALTTAEAHVGHAHRNIAAYVNGMGGWWERQHQHPQQQQHRQSAVEQQQHKHEQAQQLRPQQRGSYRYDGSSSGSSSSNSNVNDDDSIGSKIAAHSRGASRATTTAKFEKSSKTRRSYSQLQRAHDDPAAATLNDLTNLSTGLQHISDSYGRALTPSLTATAITGRMVRDQIPIYEEQQENDYDPTSVAATAAAVGASGATTSTTTKMTSATTGYAGENNQHRNGYERSTDNANGSPLPPSDDALQAAIYKLQHTVRTHNGFLPAMGVDNYPYGKYGTRAATAAAQQIASTPQEEHNFNDKISADGNFLHHYEHNSGYDELSAADVYHHHHHHPQHQQQHQQEWQPQLQQHQQLQQQQREEQQQQQQTYFSPHVSNSLPEESASDSYEPYEPATLTNHISASHPMHPHGISNPPPDVINYIPYPVVKKLHVPVHEPVQIPVSHAVIMPISKPVPIHIPITQQVQVPVEKELKIPIERVVPFPVEKHVPVPVEKRVPYPVVKYVPVKVPRPFPVKVPVFKTILHKIKGWW